MLKGMEVAAMGLFILATLLPSELARVCRVFSAPAGRLVATAWQRLPSMQRPRATTTRRRPTPTPAGPGPLERFVVLAFHEISAWAHEQDIVETLVVGSVTLVLALQILFKHLEEVYYCLRRASQRVADGRWTPLINRVFRRHARPVGGPMAVRNDSEGPQEDACWVVPGPGPVPPTYKWEPDSAVERGNHQEDIRHQQPWQSAMEMPLYYGDYYSPRYTEQIQPLPEELAWWMPPPTPTISTARPPPTAESPPVHVTAPATPPPTPPTTPPPPKPQELPAPPPEEVVVAKAAGGVGMAMGPGTQPPVPMAQFSFTFVAPPATATTAPAAPRRRPKQRVRGPRPSNPPSLPAPSIPAPPPPAPSLNEDNKEQEGARKKVRS
ncbi:hypothetical protein TWF730_008096 [Orbilia blumenaviensis]|uniref:Uncharacterized protein n=1 Tax=Orbilia blumenaviensis TaxID=1796055 RepID=A0AAV9VDI5_9PEZI